MFWSMGSPLLTPEIPVVSEEDAESVTIGREKSCYWLIDPLDGTKEFITGTMSSPATSR